MIRLRTVLQWIRWTVFGWVKLPRWGTLGVFGNNRWVKYSYIWFVVLPFAARFVVEINGGSNAFSDALHRFGISVCAALPFRWTLLFYAATAFTVASIAYSIACPRIVRDFRGALDFQHLGLTNNQLALLLYEILKKRNEPRAEWPEIGRRVILTLAPGAAGRLDRVIATNGKFSNYDLKLAMAGVGGVSESIPEAFWMVRELGETAAMKQRLLCTLFYFAGVLILIYLAVANIMTVAAASYPALESVEFVRQLFPQSGCDAS